MGRRIGKVAAFIDRDGVINEERGYVHRVTDFVLLPGVIEGLHALQAAGYALVVVTNQAGIARGFFTEEDYAILTDHMCTTLRGFDIELDAVYHCPHHPSAVREDHRIACGCRKPMPGMLLQAAQELGLTLRESVIIGDKRSDIDAGRAAGLDSCILVTSGHHVPEVDHRAADAVFPGLLEAAQWIVSRPQKPRVRFSTHY